MDKKSALKKEIVELETKARNARNKNLDAQKETGRLHRDKVQIIKDTTALKRMQEEERERFNKLSKKATDKELKFNKSESERNADRDALDKKEKDLKLLQDDLNDNDKNIEKRFATVRTREEKLVNEKADFANEKITFAKEVAEHEKEYAEFDKKNKARSAENANLEARKKTMTQNENEAIVTLDKAKEIKEKWQIKLDLVKLGQETLDKDREAFARKEAQYNKDREQLTLDQEAVTKAEEANDRRKAGLQRGSEELDKQKDEVKLSRLKVEKLIREKGIKKELEKLERDLAK